MPSHRCRMIAQGLCIAIPLLLCGGSNGYCQDATQSGQQPTLQELKDKLQRIQRDMTEVQDEIKALETTNAGTQQASQLAKGNAEEHAAEETVSPVKEGLGNIQLYGFAQMDSGYNFGQIDPAWFDTMRPSKLAAYRGEFSPGGTVFFSVRQTRFGVKTSTPTSYGDLKTIFEFELFGTGVDAGQTTFRLRHAWGEIGQIGAGQTWSPFMDPDVFPNSLEYWGPTGMVFFRNIQFRWMPINRNNLQLWVAAERPGASADEGVYAGRVDLAGVAPKFDMPDFSWRVRTTREWGHLQVAGIFRKISWVDLNATPTKNLGATVLGWGINTSSNVKFGSKDTLKLQLVYGHGIENYMNDSPIDIGTAANPGNPTRPIKGVPLPILGLVSFLDHNWSPKFSSTLGYSLTNTWNSGGELASDYHQGDYALTNLLYYPVKNVMVGGEFQFGRRLNFADGWNVNDYKLQFSAKYNFSKESSY